MKILTKVEELILLTVWKLNGNAYSLKIQNEIEIVSGKKLSLGTIYAPLDRLEKRKFITSELSESTPERGGRHKRVYTISQTGKNALITARKMHETLWSDIPDTEMELENE